MGNSNGYLEIWLENLTVIIINPKVHITTVFLIEIYFNINLNVKDLQDHCLLPFAVEKLIVTPVAFVGNFTLRLSAEWENTSWEN